MIKLPFHLMQPVEEKITWMNSVSGLAKPIIRWIFYRMPMAGQDLERL